jgi:hypothetical protein
MNKFVLKVFVFMILISIQSYAQNTFEVNFTTPEDDFVNRSLIDDEGNILLVGSIGSGQNNLTMSALIIKVSPDGSYQWRNLNRTDTVSRFSTITVLDNGNYFVTGAYSVGGDFYSMDRFWVMIFDQNLEVVTEKSYGINEPYVKYGGMNLSLINQDGDVAIVGTNEKMVNNHLRPAFIMFKFSQEGDSLFSLQYEPFLGSTPNSFNIKPGTDSLIMIGRGVISTGQESLNFMDKDMNILGAINLLDVGGGERYSNGYWINSTEFLMVADLIEDNDKGREYFFSVFRVNTAGQSLQELRLDRPDTLEYHSSCRNLVVATDSLIYVGGSQSYNAFTSRPNRSVIYLIDRDLNLLGRKNFGGDGNDFLMGIEATPDNGCFAYAERYNVDSSSYERDIYMLKFLREDFEIITQLTNQSAMALNSKSWPNPADDVLHISLDGLSQGSDFRLQIYNTAGQKFLDKALTASGITVQCRIDVLPAGTYVYKIKAESQHFLSGKFIKK